MKKLLLGTTALFALGAIPAAEAADKISLGLGGYFNAYVVGGDVDDGPGEIGAGGTREHGIGREGEIYFRGQTTLDNGILVGVFVQLEAETSADQIDNSYLYFDGSFGRVELGSTWGPGLNMFYGSPGHVIPGHGRFASQTQAPVPGIYLATGYNVIDDVNDKIAYYTPRLAGFQLGVGYAPDDKNSGATIGVDESGGGFNSEADGGVSETWVLAANYVNNFGGFDVALYGSYGEGDAETPGLSVDPSAWALGFTVGWMGFSVGANYLDQEDNFVTGALLPGGASGERSEWELGLSYATGPWTFGLAYWDVTQEIAGLSDTEANYYSAGVRYAIGPGIQLVGGVQHYDNDSGSNAAGVNAFLEGDATVFLLGTALSF